MATRHSMTLNLALLLLAGLAQAQGVYKIIGPDGKVTFSDKPPTAAQTAAGTAAAITPGGGSAGADLPYELRQVATKYPVTLYTSSPCAPCDSGRTFLKSRGVPFNEKTVTTPEDSAALERLAGESTLPFATIGGQKLRGFSESEWTQYLDAADYPKSPALPKSYRYPAATPLVAVQQVVPRKSAPAAKPVETAPPPAGPSPSNPAGITF